jgi:hypothetical protein
MLKVNRALPCIGAGGAGWYRANRVPIRHHPFVRIHDE